MPDRSKNLRKPWTGVHPTRPNRDRRVGSDRRQGDSPAAYGLPYGDRRRATGRRRGDLPRDRWLGLLVAGALGVLAAIATQHLRGGATPALAAGPPEVVIAADTLARARALRDEAEALTPTEVLHDERARERWLPLAPGLERAASLGQTPPELRAELQATLTALERAGLRR